MPRSLPTAPEWTEPSRPNVKTLELSLKVITPLFGGGYEPRETDPVSPVRAAAIRGHLRFWWRALYGAGFETAEDLFREEKALWGSAEEPGKACIRVNITNKGSLKPHSQIAPRTTPRTGPQEGIFLFPFQEQKSDGTPEASGRQEVEFRIELSAPEAQEEEIKQTLRAWIAFGGVGARTRRGCGALTVKDKRQDWLPPAEANARREWFSRLVTPRRSHHNAYHSLLTEASIVVAQQTKNPMQAWRELGKFWAQFRKGHVSGAKWDDYRTLKNIRADQIALAKPFLGLPIIFQKFSNAPFAGTLEPAESGRMASPVILKPLALSDGSYCPMVVVLQAPKPEQIKVNSKILDLNPPTADPVLKDLGVNDPLEAVIVSAEQLWKVKREVLP
jgi:CRISPR-associated protein Cmr1